MNIARDQTLAYNELPHFSVDEPYQWVPTDQCPIEVQLWILGWLMAKRCNTKVPPFPPRHMTRYFGPHDINAMNGWNHAIKEYMKDAAPASDEIEFGALDLPDWESGEAAFPLPKR